VMRGTVAQRRGAAPWRRGAVALGRRNARVARPQRLQGKSVGMCLFAVLPSMRACTYEIPNTLTDAMVCQSFRTMR